MSKHSSLAKNFKVGQKVRVARRANNFEYGWRLVWIRDMSDAVGKVFTILYMDKNLGVRLDTTGGTCWFPFTVLEAVDAKKKERNKNQRLSSVFRSAAFRLYSDYGDKMGETSYSCLAVDYECEVQHRPNKYAKNLYAEYFKPRWACQEGAWWGGLVGREEFRANQSERNLALLFMAEIVKDL